MIEHCTIIDLPQFLEERGNLTFIESEGLVPFKVKRTHWIYDVPGGEFRGSHAYKKNKEFVIALSGSFDITLHDGKREQKFSLNRSYYGLYVPHLIWRSLDNFSTNALALVLSSEHYNENDYIWNYEEFKKLI